MSEDEGKEKAVDDVMRKRLFHGEMQLLKWSEDHNQGAKVVLQLADNDMLEAFKKMTTRHGKIAGQRLLVVMWEIDAQEGIVDQRDANRMFEDKHKPRAGPLCILAGRWCSMQQFHDWLKMRHEDAWEAAKHDLEARGLSMVPQEVAAQVIRNVCAVASRRDIDADHQARDLFNKTFRLPFMAVLGENPLVE